MHRNRLKILTFTKYRDLETQVKRPTRSSEMTPFDRSFMTSYLWSIVTMALSCTVLR